MKEISEYFLAIVFVSVCGIIYYYNFSDRANLLDEMKTQCYSSMIEYAPSKKVAKNACNCIIDEIKKNLTIQEAIDIKKNHYPYSMSHWVDDEILNLCGEKYYEK